MPPVRSRASSARASDLTAMKSNIGDAVGKPLRPRDLLNSCRSVLCIHRSASRLLRASRSTNILGLPRRGEEPGGTGGWVWKDQDGARRISRSGMRKELKNIRAGGISTWIDEAPVQHHRGLPQSRVRDKSVVEETPQAAKG